MKTACHCLLVLILTVAATAAVAATPDQEKAAESLVAQAKQLVQEGSYERAARLYMQAYGDVPRPAIVFNAARAYEQASLWAEAKPLFELYLQIDKGQDADSAAGRVDAQQHLAAVNAKIAAEQARKIAPPPAVIAPTEPIPVPVAPLPPPQSPVIRTPPVILEPPEADPPRNLEDVGTTGQPDDGARPDAQWSGAKTAGIVALSTGAVFVIASVAIALVAHSDLADLDARLAGDHVANNQGLTLHGAVTQVEMADGIATYNARQITAAVLGGMGAAAVVAGGILWWQDGRQSDGRMALSPGIAPTQGGATWTLAGHF